MNNEEKQSFNWIFFRSSLFSLRSIKKRTKSQISNVSTERFHFFIFRFCFVPFLFHFLRSSSMININLQFSLWIMQLNFSEFNRTFALSETRFKLTNKFINRRPCYKNVSFCWWVVFKSTNSLLFFLSGRFLFTFFFVFFFGCWAWRRQSKTAYELMMILVFVLILLCLSQQWDEWFEVSYSLHVSSFLICRVCTKKSDGETEREKERQSMCVY